MLKNKKKTYLLLVVVLGIWGVIGYQIWTGLQHDTAEIKIQEVNINFNREANTAIDTFSIQTASRDPFLGTLTTKKKKSRVINPAKKIVWLPISYQGVVKKQGSKEQVFVITINGQQHLLKKGQSRDSVSLVRGSAKSIVVRYKKQQKTITIQ